MKLGKLLFSIVIVSLLVSMAIPMAAAPKPDKPGGGGKPNDPPADPTIALVKQRDQGVLEVMNSDGSNRAVIFRTNSGIVSEPTWSPDGISLAFTRMWIGSFYGQIWAIDVQVVAGKPTGSNLRMIYDDCYPGDSAWSPLGDEIAFTGMNRPTGEATAIQVISVDSGETQTLYQASEGIAVKSPTWSSDGSQIAFVEMVLRGPKSMKIIDSETGGVLTTLLDAEEFRDLDALDWARNDDVIAFMGARPGEGYWINTIDVSSREVTLVVQGASPTWSPENTHLAFVLREKSINIKSIDLVTRETETLTKNGIVPDWSRA